MFGEPPPPAVRRSRAGQLIRLTVECLVGLVLVTFVVSSSLDQLHRANELLVRQLAARNAELAHQQAQIAELQAEVADLKERWFGSPALWVPPAISNTDIEFFDVTGTTQQQLISSLNNSSICTTHTCRPDPAVPNGIAWGLEGARSDSYLCYSPRATTVIFRTYVLLPRWSPPPDGTVRIPLVEAWNSLAQVIYTHEAGHVAIDVRDVAALNDQAHHLGSCQALIDFWANPSVFDNLNADQDAYHARLHADCRPEIGCIPPGWLGW